MLAAIREGYEQHYGQGRVLRTEDRDLALLAGDRLYALGLALLADRGDLRAVAVLADLISECASAHAEDDAGPRGGGVAPRQDRVGRRRVSCPAASRSILFAALPRSERPFVPDPRKTPKSKYTADRDIAGAFEGETVTRRRFMTLTAHGAGAVAVTAFALPALGFAAGSALFDRPEVQWESVGAPEDFPDDTYVPKVITETSGVGQTGKTTIYMRARNDQDPPPNPEQLHEGTTDDFLAISTRCMHLGCPVRYVDASKKFICPCHGGVYDFDGRASPAARPCARSTVLRARARRPGAGRPALFGQLRVPPLPQLPRPRTGARRHRPVHVPRPLLDPEARLGP